jgi:hypothetical protein
LWLTFKYSARDLKSVTINANRYTSTDEFARDYLVYAYARKGKWFKTGIDIRQAALASEQDAESRMQTVNRSLTYSPLIEKARLRVISIIGESPGDYFHSCGFGPGATFDIKGRFNPEEKLNRTKVSVTRSCLPYLRAAMATDYQWLSCRGIEASGPVYLLDSEFEIVDGNRVVTVAKDAFTDRSIAAEPTGNIYVQKGLGNVLRKRLKPFADLDDQVPNQILAREGSVSGKIATIDLSQASDSVSIKLVKMLLPEKWYEVLTSSRSACSRIGDSWRLNEKFSSMGNGFTFELESLIFYCLLSHLDENLSVYGDDICIKSSSVEEAFSILKECGFLVNKDKSFWSGPFRESCGKHYFSGVDVTPIYQKEDIYGRRKVTSDYAIYSALNRIRRWCSRSYGEYSGDGCCKRSFDRAQRILTDQLKRHLFIPDGMGDGGIVSSGEMVPIVYKEKQSGRFFRTLLPRSHTVPAPFYTYRSSLAGGSERATYGSIGIRTRPKYYLGLVSFP